MTQPYVWAPDRRNRAQHLIRRELVRLSQMLFEQAAAMEELDEDGAKRARARAYDLQQRGALTKVEPELQAHPLLTLTTEDFDADNWLLNTPDGIVDLQTGSRSPPDPSALASKATSVAPATGEPARWFQFLDEATGGDTELQAYLQRLAGYALTGSTQEQILAFIHGPTRSGKSTFLGALSGVMGSYHVTASADTFAKTTSRGVPADLAMMAGARLVTASETQEGRAWDTQRVKSITGGDEISARFLYQNYFTYTPQYQVIIVGNSEPEIVGVDEAIMRRLHIVPFDEQVPEEDVDRLLGAKLEAEYPAILSWAIEGCLEWIDKGLCPPPSVIKRTEQYRQEEDPIALFLEECCELGPEHEVTGKDLYSRWSTWCKRQGEDPKSRKHLTRMLRTKEDECGLSYTRVEDGDKNRRGFSGIRLVEREGGLTV